MRHSDHLKITLHEAVLTRCSVLHDVSIIKLYLFTTDECREVGLVHHRTLSLRNHHPFSATTTVGSYRPFAETGEHLIHIISVSIYLRCSKLTATHRHFPLGRIAAIYNYY